MNKDLEFHIRFATNGRDFLVGDLAFQNHTFDTHGLGHAYAGAVVDAHLRRGMDRELGEMVLDKMQHTQVLHDNGIGPDRNEFCEYYRDIRDFNVFN